MPRSLWVIGNSAKRVKRTDRHCSGLGPPARSLTATVIGSATNASSLLLSKKIQYSIPSASSSDETTLASVFHSPESTPEENGHLPRGTYPPPTFLAWP